MKTVGYAAHDSEKPLEPYHFERPHFVMKMYQLKSFIVACAIQTYTPQKTTGAGLSTQWCQAMKSLVASLK